MDEETLEKVKNLAQGYYSAIRTTDYDEGEYKMLMYDLTYKLMKLVNPEMYIPVEGLKPESELE